MSTNNTSNTNNTTSTGITVIPVIMDNGEQHPYAYDYYYGDIRIPTCITYPLDLTQADIDALLPQLTKEWYCVEELEIKKSIPQAWLQGTYIVLVTEYVSTDNKYTTGKITSTKLTSYPRRAVRELRNHHEDIAISDFGDNIELATRIKRQKYENMLKTANRLTA